MPKVLAVHFPMLTLDGQIQIREYGRIANMADPFGNGFDLIEVSGPGYDNVKR